jgi:hypothetical protein
VRRCRIGEQLLHRIWVANALPVSRPITDAPITPRNIVSTSPMFEDSR